MSLPLQSSISSKKIESIASKACSSRRSKVEILDYKIEPFTSQRQGIMGNHYSLLIRWFEVAVDKEEDGEKIERSIKLFVKTSPKGQPSNIADESIILEEVNFFNKIHPLLVEDYEGEKWSPMCYLADSELIALEDLRSLGYERRIDSMYDLEAMKSAVETLARFHATSLMVETKFGKKLNEIYPGMFKEKIFVNEGKAGESNRIAFDTLRLIALRFGLDGSSMMDILKYICELVKPTDETSNVICHGDLWRNNVLFNDSSATTPKCILVDYQMLRYASLTLDLVMLLYVHSNPQFRDNHESWLLLHYYRSLNDVASKRDVGDSIASSSSSSSAAAFNAKIPSYEKVLKEYESRRIVGMAYSAMRWPPAVMANLQDTEALEKWLFVNRIDGYNEAMDKDRDYETRMKNCLVELLQEADKVLKRV